MIAAPVQTDRAAWQATRVGRFTASMFGVLMTEPRSVDIEAIAHLVPRDIGYRELKSGPRKGELTRVPNFRALAIDAARAAGALPFGAEALGMIRSKAIERLTGYHMADGVETAGSRRGLLLEPAAIHILSRVWRPLDTCTWQAWGDNLGSTPDALVDGGKSTMDLKCPVNPADVVAFADEVPDGDFNSLLAWDSRYAWQVMVQALTCGCDTAHLVYFTDRLPIHKLATDDLQEAQTLIDLRADQHSQESVYPWSYQYATDGYFFAARSFPITEEIKATILSTLDRAERACIETMERLRPLLSANKE